MALNGIWDEKYLPLYPKGAQKQMQIIAKYKQKWWYFNFNLLNFKQLIICNLKYKSIPIKGTG